MIAWISCDWETPTFHGVSENNTRSICLFLTFNVSLDQRVNIVSTKILYYRREFSIAHPSSEKFDLDGSPFEKSVPQLCDWETKQRLVLLIRDFIDPVAQTITSRKLEGFLHELPVFQLNYMPTGCLEMTTPLIKASPWDYAVQ
jgi:hypothetical protein